MKEIWFPVLIIVIVVVLAACAPLLRSSAAPTTPAQQSAPAQAGPTTAAVRTISPADAKARLEQESGIQVVDVRTQEEYDQGHLRASVLVPLDELTTLAPEKLPDKNAVLFVYCRSGRRSALAAQQLVTMGYTQVFDLGGIQSWPYEVTKD